MKRIWNAVTGSLSWNRAIDRVRERKYDIAIQELYSIQTSGSLNVEIFTMLGLCHINLEQNSLAIAALYQADYYLNKFKNKFSSTDFNYLSAYIIVSKAIADGNADGNNGTYNPPNWDEIDIGDVSKHFLSKFPNREHPHWDESLIN